MTKYRLFCLDSLFFLSVPPSQDFLTSPTPFQPFGALVAALWLCRPGAQWSCRSEISSGDTCVAMRMVAGSWGALTTPNIHAAWDLVVLRHVLVEGGMGEVPVSPYSSNQTPLIGRSCWGALFATPYQCLLQQKHHEVWFTAWEATARHRLNPAVGRSVCTGTSAKLFQFSGAL